MKKKNLLQRTIIIVLITLVGIYVVIGPRRRPTPHDFTWSGIKATLASNIHLGLDLKGGTHLVMRVKTDEVLKNLSIANAVAIEKAAKDAGLPVKQAAPQTAPGAYRITLEATDASKLSEIEEAVKGLNREELAKLACRRRRKAHLPSKLLNRHKRLSRVGWMR